MVAIERLLLCSKDCYELFKGQDWCFHGAALAYGLLWVCKIGERPALLGGLLEELFCFWISVIYWARICGFACHHVELLPKFDINVMSFICTTLYGMSCCLAEYASVFFLLVLFCSVCFSISGVISRSTVMLHLLGLDVPDLDVLDLIFQVMNRCILVNVLVVQHCLFDGRFSFSR